MGALPPPVSDISIAANGITPPSFWLTVGLHLRKAARRAQKTGRVNQDAPGRFFKNLVAFRRRSGERKSDHFFGDMCGEENTSQAASVEFVRRRRTNYARSRLQAFLSENKMFSDSQKLPEQSLREFLCSVSG